MNPLGFQELKVVALAADDLPRAENFYRHTLELAPAMETGDAASFILGNVIIMLKPTGKDWPARPGAQLNPRLTLAVDHALQTEQALAARGVAISDPVQLYENGSYYVGAFLDSEGNKLWFCSAVTKE